MIEPLIAFLLMPWIWGGLTLIILMVTLALDSTIFAGVFTGFVGFLVLRAYWGSIDWITTAIFIGCYIGIGLLFSFVKWWFYTRKQGREFRLFQESRNQSFSPGQIADEWNNSWSRSRFFKVAYSTGRWDVKYDVFSLSTKVFFWTLYWPIYALLILMEDFLKELVDAFVKMFGKVFHRIAVAAFNAE